MSKVRSDNISNRADDGAPKLTYGVEVPVGYGITGAGFINVSGDSTFNGNVSIAGTLTYDDVTNIDSVGIVTARNGIRVGAGESIGPISGTITYYGDGSKLTNLPASGGGDSNDITGCLFL